MTDTLTPAAQRFQDVRDALLDHMDTAIRQLTEAVRELGGAMEVDFPGGLVLRVTRKQAQLRIHNPTPEIVEELELSGRSFCVTGNII